MSEIAVRLDGLSKQYRIGGKQEGYRTIREAMTNAVVSPFRRAQKLIRGQAYGAAELDETIWALRGVSLEIKRGEVVGIIGPNGAGKTTLLKILSRITEPTEGCAEIHGRVGSLLEVGTGFHPELTGRENIYLNGAILGMKKVEIERRFDEIVDFAEIEKFIDTPVKHYSSGMYVRLAFAVAAHLEPEILVVDEVLAVGDVAFQKKCLGKMGDVVKEGRTVLFVSHNMNAITQLCDRTIFIDNGQIIKDGNSQEVVSYYLSETIIVCSKKSFTENPQWSIQIIENTVSTSRENDITYIPDNVDIHINFIVKITQNLERGNISFFLQKDEITIFNAFDIDVKPSLLDSRPQGYWQETFVIPKNTLKPGLYRVLFTSAVFGRTPYQNNIAGVSFEVYSVENTAFKSYAPFRGGLIRYIGNWTFHDLPLTGKANSKDK